MNSSGCDSVIFTNYILHPIAITHLQKMDCSYAQYFIDTITLSGTYCDSLVITEYIPLRMDRDTIISNTCDITKADTVTLNLKNILGCDSIVTIYTVFTNQQMTFLTEKICGLFKSYLDTMKYISGNCDSLVITNHIALSLDTIHIQSSTCDKTKAGIFSKILTNQSGCDSLIIEEISLLSSDSTFITKSTCDILQAGTNIQTFKNNFGCDSIILTNIQFIPSDTFRITRNTCILSEAGIDTSVFAGTICDSVIFTTTVFIPSDTTRITQTTCDPGSVGFSTISKQNSNGCDSLILITTNYQPLHLNYDLDSISCFDLNDGVFKILNSSDFGAPYEIILNNVNLGNLNQIDHLGPGNYRIFIRDSKGCLTDSVLFT
jgi:hypothetical protein